MQFHASTGIHPDLCAAMCAQGGASLAFGSDWPVVKPDALFGAYVSVHRRGPTDPANETFFPTEAINAEQALLLSTIEGARMAGLDSSIGSLE